MQDTAVNSSRLNVVILAYMFGSNFFSADSLCRASIYTIDSHTIYILKARGVVVNAYKELLSIAVILAYMLGSNILKQIF